MDNEVLERDIEQPVVPEKGQGKDDKGGKDPVQERIERLERRLAESEQSERFWAGIAKNGGGGRQAEPEEDDTPDASEFLADDDTEELDGDTPEKAGRRIRGHRREGPVEARVHHESRRAEAGDGSGD
jgi:hypothetical protein